MRKICVITGSRAEYGLLHNVCKLIKNDEELELQILVTGMHLSQEFGLTYKQIEADGFEITDKIEMLLSSNTPSSISKSIGLGIIGFSDVFKHLNPDMIVLLGDRFEILSAAIAAMNAVIPIAHIHGGETGAGTIDNMIRHAITKMSAIHFVSTSAYRNRVIQLGENPEKVFLVGAPGIENIKKMTLLNRSALIDVLKFDIDERTIIVTYHPLSLEKESAMSHFKIVLEALDKIESIRIIFTKSNADAGGSVINGMIDDYVKVNPKNTLAVTSLGTYKYLSTVKNVKAVVGNSSSGIIEAPSLGTFTLDIGDRQKGRVRANSVINCELDTEEIVIKLNRILNGDYKKLDFNNPYEHEGTSSSIVKHIKENLDSDKITNKEFYDIRF